MTAMVITGEGARGSIQAGIIHALAMRGITADHYYGVSSGSINSAALSLMPTHDLVRIWRDINKITDVFGLHFPIRKRGLLNLKPLQKLLRSEFANTKLYRSKSTVTRLCEGDGSIDYVHNLDVSRTDYERAILDSVSISGLVHPLGKYVDAGPRMLTPIAKAVQDGHTSIKVIMGRPMELNEFDPPRFPSLTWFVPFAAASYRALDMMMHEIMRDDIVTVLERNLEARLNKSSKYKVIDIEIFGPKKYHFDALDFDKCYTGVDIGLRTYERIHL